MKHVKSLFLIGIAGVLLWVPSQTSEPAVLSVGLVPFWGAALWAAFESWPKEQA